MPHAEASNFRPNITKAEAYDQILSQMRSLMDGQRNWVCNLANASSLLWHAYQSLPTPSNQVNWAGFYTINPLQSLTTPSLILGPFQGRVACQEITFGRGVCGAAAISQKTVLVKDVEDFPGHIACDGASKSEIVVPILRNSATVVGANEKSTVSSRPTVIGVIDIDCAVVGGFDEEDARGLEELSQLLAEGCDW